MLKVFMIESSLLIPKNVVSGNLNILFSHPEAFLSIKGRSLLKLDTYQSRIVACVIDEAHCIKMWDKEFRTTFTEISSFKAVFPSAVTVALTATASEKTVQIVLKSLCMKINVFLEVEKSIRTK